MSSSNLMRWSGLAALVGGVLLIGFEVLNVALFPGEHGSEVMATGSWFIVQIMGLVGMVLVTLGLVGLYARQAGQTGSLGLIGFVMAFSGMFMVFGLAWGEPFLGPMIAEEAPELLEIEPSGALVAGLLVTLLLVGLGWLLFGLASLRAGVLPRGAAVLLMVGAVLFVVLALLELPLWSVVLGAAVAWIGVALRSSGTEPSSIPEVAM